MEASPWIMEGVGNFETLALWSGYEHRELMRYRSPCHLSNGCKKSSKVHAYLVVLQRKQYSREHVRVASTRCI
uniref:Uncharacterized protein n=1 Tax=Parascaris equorum TaxID=6256 RepID=A0A914RKK1_PAREQ